MIPPLEPRQLIRVGVFAAGVFAMIFLPVHLSGGAGSGFALFRVAVYLAAAAGAVFLWRYYSAKERARRKRFAEFAAAQAWKYSADIRRGIEVSFPGFELFTRGTSRYGDNFLTGTFAEHALTAFDYHYKVVAGSGKKTRTRHYEFTVIVLKPRFPLKPLTIRKENLADRIAASFGWDDLDFESAEFSAKYHVSAPDRRWAYDVLTARTLAVLLDRNAGNIHLSALHIMLPLPFVKDPADILPACETAAALLDGIPEYARKRRKKGR